MSGPWSKIVIVTLGVYCPHFTEQLLKKPDDSSRLTHHGNSDYISVSLLKNVIDCELKKGAYMTFFDTKGTFFRDISSFAFKCYERIGPACGPV
jgi:hypothetical protein